MNIFVKYYNKLPHYLPSALLIIGMMALTLFPVPAKMVPPVSNADKIAHFLMFGAIATILWLDIARHKFTPPLWWPQFVIAAVCSSALGGAIELLQGTEFVNRSCDIMDFWADCAGAFILPILLRPLIWRWLPTECRIQLRTVSVPSPELEKIYREAFPPEEQRPWSDILSRAANSNQPLRFTEVMYLGKAVGLISWWQFPKWAYLEHFAVHGKSRGNGIGATALKQWLASLPTPAVLEVELPDANDMAPRRIRFYERLGFTARSEWRYVQPPYGPGLPSVPLMLMTYGNLQNLGEVESVLHSQVYGA